MASSSVKSFEIDIATNPNAIIVTANPVLTNQPEAIVIANIANVSGQFFDYSLAEANNSGDEFRETYPYPTMTVITFFMNDGETKVSLELQSCTNQATWSGGAQADLQQALSDINALL